MSHFNLQKIALATLALTISGTALAGEPATDAASIRVDYSDLNLQTRAGAETLHERLRAAARSVCPDTSSRDLRTALAGRQCVANAVNRAVAEVAQPQLALVHSKSTSKS